MLPLFYSEQRMERNKSILLDEETSKHIVQVLRMKRGEHLQLTDGKGSSCNAVITDDHKKKVVVSLEEKEFQGPDKIKITIGISLLKNPNRFEWFLEKATEIGISEIVPMICERTERLHFRLDRMKSLLVSAMLQSRQYWIPQLQEPVSFRKLVESAQHQQKYIAHCLEEEKKKLVDVVSNSVTGQIMLIGPEGDFVNEEVKLAMDHQFLPVTLGKNRLRAETAGVVAATLMKLNS